MIEVINVSSKGQIVIPERMRNELKIKPGSRLIAIESNGQILLKKEEEILEKLQDESKESMGWLALAENSLNEVWDNKKDDTVWKRYL